MKDSLVAYDAVYICVLLLPKSSALILRVVEKYDKMAEYTKWCYVHDYYVCKVLLRYLRSKLGICSPLRRLT